jgi:hypothetical protein
MQTPYIVWKEVEAFAAQFKIDGVSILLDDTAKKFAHAFANASLMSYASANFAESQVMLRNAVAVAKQDVVNIPTEKKIQL